MHWLFCVYSFSRPPLLVLDGSGFYPFPWRKDKFSEIFRTFQAEFRTFRVPPAYRGLGNGKQIRGEEESSNEWRFRG